MKSRVFFWSLTSALAGFLFGFDTVVISGAEQTIQALWSLGPGMHGIAMASALYGTVLGSMLGGWPTDRFGRRATLLWIGILYFVSAVWSGLAPDVYSLIIARLIGGLGVGISTVAAPLYISEIAPPERRGRLAGMFQFNIVLGILVAFLSNALLGGGGKDAWRWMLGVEAFPALLYTVLCLGIPESPRWLLGRQGDRQKGVEVLRLIEPGAAEPQIQADADTIIAASFERASSARFWNWRLRVPILLAFLIAFFNQLSGINAVLYFAPRIFEMTGLGASAALLQSVGIGVTNLFFTFVGLWLIDRLGRRTLLIIGSLGYICSLGLVAWAFFTQHFSVVPVCIFAFIASHAVGQGAVIWVFISEIFPNRHRAEGQALGSFTHWMFAALLTSFFPKMVTAFAPGYIFLFFCGMMMLQLVWVKLMVPETKGISLEALQHKLGIEVEPEAAPSARTKTSLLLFASLLAVPTALDAADASARGVRSLAPAIRWEDAFVTGNGRMGAMLFGNPTNDTLIANHCRLFLPLGNREIVPDLARHVPELRQIIREKGYDEAMKFFLGKAKEQGYPGIIPTDPFHPGLFVNIRQPADGPITDYARTEDFQTGEVAVRWRDNRGRFQRRVFVSRTDNVIAFWQTGPAPCKLLFLPVSPDDQTKESGAWTADVGSNLIQSDQQAATDWMTYHNVYVKGKGGYDVAVRIVRRDEGRDVLLLIRIVPWKTPMPKEQSEAWAYSFDNPDFKRPGRFDPAPPLADSSVVACRAAGDALALMPKLKRSVADLRADYARLLSPHAKAHGALFNRVALDLGGGTDRAKTVEELLDTAQKENRLPAALMEKIYDAGRYMLICCAGELPPNLQGIWNGTWKPAWSGDFTLDTNVQAAMAAACSGNLPELMEGYFRLMESFYPEWRLNARRTYGCRGVFTNTRASNTALALHWGEWPGVFWAAGCGWLASLFTDYAQYTGDREFLANRCVPLLKEIAVFYEDFLRETDKDGRVTFIPSYNPETGCGINATMDIAVAREMLMKLIAACRELNIERDEIAKWESLLAKLPAYPINRAGELCEWPGSELAAGHRHHSQLYPCFQSFDPLFETSAELRQAAQATVRAKTAASDLGGKGNEQSSFGRVQAGVSAAYLGMAEEAYGRLKVMAVKRSMYPSLVTSHEPNGRAFNTDGNGGIPQIVNTMLVFSRPGRLDLLPALPAEWPTGEIRGILAPRQITINRLAWDKPAGAVHLTLTSGIQQTITLRLGEQRQELALKKDKPAEVKLKW